MTAVLNKMPTNAPVKALPAALFITAIVVTFTISPMMLERFGIAYDSEGGASWQKIHPATYLAILAFIGDLVSRRNPLARIAGIGARFPGLMLFAAMWILLALYVVFVQHATISELIDNYGVGVVFLILYEDLPVAVQDFLRRFLHAAMFCNAIIAIAELVFHFRLTPYVLSGVEVIGDYRSTALLGHPLINAATAGTYLLCLVLGGDTSLQPLQRLVLVFSQVAALVAFGGRTAIVIVGGIIVLNVAKSAALLLLGKSFDIRLTIATVLGMPFVFIAASIAIYGGAFDQLTQRFVNDNGSALARVTLFRLFDVLPFEDLMFGADQSILASAKSTLGIEIAVESTWFAWVFQYGAFMTFFFVAGLFALWWEIWRRTRQGAFLLFAFFFVVISSSIGLAGKSYEFCQFIILLVVLFRQESAARQTETKPAGVTLGGMLPV